MQELTLSNLTRFATLEPGPTMPQRRLIPLAAKTYADAIKHDGTVFARIPHGLIDWWIIKDAGKVKYPADWLVSDIRREM